MLGNTTVFVVWDSKLIFESVELMVPSCPNQRVALPLYYWYKIKPTFREAQLYITPRSADTILMADICQPTMTARS